jgi:DNA-directed RNA polymerase II subunit RPB2
MLVDMGAAPPTDRDSYSNKRIHWSGVGMAKTFKTLFNLSAVIATKRAIAKAYKAQSHDKIDLKHVLTAEIYGHNFERVLLQAIKSAKNEELKVGAHRTVSNRMSAQLLSRKACYLNTYAQQRQVSTPMSNASKASDRALKMRQMHPSGIGFICPISSPEGERVGINKQLAYTANVTLSSNSTFLKEQILKDKDIIKLSDVTPSRYYNESLSRIYVNGDWFACTKNTYDKANYFRSLRRKGIINYNTTIVWNAISNNLKFWNDFGRMTRPLLIVYNNWDDPEMFNEKSNVIENEKKFKQGILLNSKHIELLKGGLLTTEDLLKEGIMEFITPEEQENCLLACGPNTLQKYANDPRRRFTHLDIPQSMLSIIAHVGVYAHCNATARNIFEANQAKQTAGDHVTNWAYRYDKNTYRQYENEFPLVNTRINRFLPPNGMNIMVALTCSTGYNQEDSSEISLGGCHRGGFLCSKFTTLLSELKGDKEKFEIPDSSNTRNIIKGANYSKLGDDAYATRGTVLNKGDIAIAKKVQLSEDSKDRKYTFSDSSTMYKEYEQGIVYNTIQTKDPDGTKFTQVCVSISRPPQEGDKFSSRTGQKGICGMRYHDSEMLYTEDGTVPFLVMNSHAIPTRMTIGDLYEKITGNWCAKKGCHADATMFYKHNIESYMAELSKMGLDPYARQNVYNGFTGERMYTMILMGVTYYQRLLKFVMDNYQTSTRGPTDPITHQPIASKQLDGGLRMGEMEKDVIVQHGAMRFLMSKFSADSDGFPVYICNTCNNIAIVNHGEKKEQPLYECRTCGDAGDIREIQSSCASKVFFQEVMGMHRKVQFILEPHRFETYKD